LTLCMIATASGSACFSKPCRILSSRCCRFMSRHLCKILFSNPPVVSHRRL
jgi:hypothetical protein